MPYCENCGAEVSKTAIFCKSCGMHLEPEPKEAETHEVVQKPWKKKWFLAVVGVLLVGLTIGAVLLINKHNPLQDVELASAKGTLNTYLGYVIQKNKPAMWDMVHPDSKALYKDFKVQGKVLYQNDAQHICCKI